MAVYTGWKAIGLSITGGPNESTEIDCVYIRRYIYNTVKDAIPLSPKKEASKKHTFGMRMDNTLINMFFQKNSSEYI